LHLQIGAGCSEGAIKILRKIAHPNGRFGEIHCIAENSPLRVRENAASAIVAAAQVGFVPHSVNSDITWFRGCGESPQ
jgi:hypothetical protein